MDRVTLTFESASAVIKKKDGYVWLTRVFSKKRGLGHATGLMKLIVNWAEDNGIDICLMVRPYSSVVNKGILSEEQLIEFYQKHGFRKYEVKHRNVHMVYISNSRK